MTSQEKLQEAVNQINLYVDNNDEMYTGYQENNEALKIAVECIEKQIPKKPNIIKFGLDGFISWSCSNCGVSARQEIVDIYCHNCGQRLEW